jgi:hypothetical protein
MKRYKSATRMMPRGLSPDETHGVCAEVGKLLTLYVDGHMADIKIETPFKQDPEHDWTGALAIEHLRPWTENLTAFVLNARQGQAIRFENIPPVALRGKFASPPLDPQKLRH